MLRALAIFDLDGTLLDTLDDLTHSVNYALCQSGLPVRTRDEVRKFVGNGIGQLIHRAVAGNSPAELEAKVYQAFMTHYHAHCADRTRPYEGVLSLLAALRSKGCRTAVVSNKADFAVKALCERYFAGYLDLAVGERDGIRRKPAPDTVVEVLRTLGIPREQAVYIGDSDVDIATAANAQLDCISVDWGFRDRAFLGEHGAKTIVSKPAQILGIMEDGL